MLILYKNCTSGAWQACEKARTGNWGADEFQTFKCQDEAENLCPFPLPLNFDFSKRIFAKHINTLLRKDNTYDKS